MRAVTLLRLETYHDFFNIIFFSRTEETPIASVLVYSLQLNYLTYTDPWSDDLENSTSLSIAKKIMGGKKARQASFILHPIPELKEGFSS